MPPDNAATLLVPERPDSPAAPDSPAPPARRLRVADVTMFYGERSGGIRTYLEAKAEFAARTGAFEHHLVVPGRPAGNAPQTAERHRHEQPSVRLAASNGYRIPLGGAGLQATLRALAPDVVLLHDPYWTPRLASRAAHELGAAVIAVHHSSAALHAAGLPGPQGVYRRALRHWYRRAYVDVDAVMSVIDPGPDTARRCTVPLRLGLGTRVPPPSRRPRKGRARALCGAALAREGRPRAARGRGGRTHVLAPHRARNRPGRRHLAGALAPAQA